MIQLDHDEEMGSMHGMYGSPEAESEAQRTIKRAALTAVRCLLKKVISPTLVHFDDKGVSDGLWRGEMKCTDPKANDADLWISSWEALHRLHRQGILVEVSSMPKAHRTMEKMQQMSLFERFIAEGNEKADEFAKEGALLDGGLMAQVRASTVQQEREEVYAALQNAAGFHCLVDEREDRQELKPKPKEKRRYVNKKRNGKETSEWCEQTSIGVGDAEEVAKTRRDKRKVKDRNGCVKTPSTSWEDGANRVWEGTAW